jgi:hypothetical protein
VSSRDARSHRHDPPNASYRKFPTDASGSNRTSTYSLVATRRMDRIGTALSRERRAELDAFIKDAIGRGCPPARRLIHQARTAGPLFRRIGNLGPQSKCNHSCATRSFPPPRGFWSRGVPALFVAIEVSIASIRLRSTKCAGCELAIFWREHLDHQFPADQVSTRRTGRRMALLRPMQGICVRVSIDLDFHLQSVPRRKPRSAEVGSLRRCELH